MTIASRIALGVALAASIAAAPRPAFAGTHAAHAVSKKQSVVLKPLFDMNQRFKPHKSVVLRFRVQDAKTRKSLAAKDVSFSLLHGTGSDPLSYEVKNGVFEVPFNPTGPGRFAIVATVRGAPMGSVPPVRLGVVGVADGLTELPPSADAEFQGRSRAGSRSSR